MTEESQRISPLPGMLGKTILLPVNSALAAAEREAIKLGVPTSDILQLLLEHVCSIVAHIEPPGVRAQTIKDVVGAIPELTRKMVLQRNTTPGGVVLPRHTTAEPELAL